MKPSGNKLEVKKLDSSYNDRMLEILKSSPMVMDDMTLCVDQSPNVFKMSELQYPYFENIGFFTDEKLDGFGTMGYHEVYVNGKEETVYQFTNLYLSENLKKKGIYFKASEVIFKERYKNAKYGYSIIMKDNKPAEGLINRNHERFPHIPSNKIIGDLDIINIIINFKTSESKKIEVRNATYDDVDDILQLLNADMKNRLFGLILTKDIFLQKIKERPEFEIENYFLALIDDKIVGVCTAWDTQSFKKNRILKYSYRFLPTRIIVFILSTLFGCPNLPKVGKALKSVYISEFTTKERNPEIMEALLSRIYNIYRKKKYNIIIFGSSSKDPLLSATKKFMTEKVSAHIIVSSHQRSMDDEKLDVKLPYIDLALL